MIEVTQIVGDYDSSIGFWLKPENMWLLDTKGFDGKVTIKSATNKTESN